MSQAGHLPHLTLHFKGDCFGGGRHYALFYWLVHEVVIMVSVSTCVVCAFCFLLGCLSCCCRRPHPRPHPHRCLDVVSVFLVAFFVRAIWFVGFEW